MIEKHRGVEEWEKLASDKFLRQAAMNEPDKVLLYLRVTTLYFIAGWRSSTSSGS